MSISGQSTRRPNVVLLFGLVWLGVSAQLLWLYWSGTAQFLGDTDDAMRLIEVRAFLAGRGWFDLHEPRLQPPIGYDTHWSRLIDAGLAGLFLILRCCSDPALAERLMRAIWPLLWLAFAMVGTTTLAWRLGGRVAAVVSLLLLIFIMPMQFEPGRVDHHNVQIALALLTLAAAIWSDRVSWAPWAAGALSGLALAIGFENMAFILLPGGLFAARFALDRTHAAALSKYGFSTAVSTAVFFFSGVAPGRWTTTACDAIAINTAVPAIAGALVLFLAGRRFADPRQSIRFVGVGAAAAAAFLVFLVLEPRCLRGPLAMVDPIARSVWLSQVSEAQPLLTVIAKEPVAGLSFAFYSIAGLVSAMAVAVRSREHQDSAFAAQVAALLVAAAMTLTAVRAAPYTFWFAMPFFAALLMNLFTRWKLTSLPIPVLAIVPIAPLLVAWIGNKAIDAINPSLSRRVSGPSDACFEIPNYAAVARLPAGIVAADIDYGPFLLALTPHSVIGAPYHRLSYGIVASHRAFAEPPEQAREILGQAKATYVMTCGSPQPENQAKADSDGSLASRLRAGNVPDWLEAVPGTGPFNVYRVKP